MVITTETPPRSDTRPRKAVRGGAAGARIPFWFAVPCLLIFAGVVAYPTLQGMYYAFTDWTGLGSDIHFNGIDNFVKLFSSPEAPEALGHTLLIAASVTIIQNLLGLLLAIGLHSKIKSRNVLRTLLFAPVVMTPVIVGYVWQFIFVPGGPFASLTESLGAPVGGLNVLGDPAFAIWGIITIVIWQHAGYSMVIFLAGMQNVPDELLEASALDGANAVQRFFWITWPLLRTPTLINVTLSLISSMKLFDQVMATTQGGPGNATQTLSTLLFSEAFLYNNYGYGISLGLIVFILIAVISFGQMRLFRERD
ncbi:carbohydrate ABC transporter permease [Sinomonas gamaensis]|uniref:carbohydrate ABC transporter permease n=1 Tax=Sinomonas gamaensis TaxID=2565624 RepID=UPI001BB1F08F|nr:sugar ABC transporter permease [Sinomonas gamaensis]